MHCQEARKQLQLYVDGRLTLVETRTLEIHVSGCDDCCEELALLEEVSQQLNMIQFVAEPQDMHAQIMQRVALAPPRRSQQSIFHWRPSLWDLLAAILLATVATLGSILGQPSLRKLLPIANGHDSLSLAFINLVHTLPTMDSRTLMLVLWVFGTFLGVFITLAFAGTEMRSRWLKAMMDRLPVR